jgi:hypothetical protein
MIKKILSIFKKKNYNKEGYGNFLMLRIDLDKGKRDFDAANPKPVYKISKIIDPNNQ